MWPHLSSKERRAQYFSSCKEESFWLEISNHTVCREDQGLLMSLKLFLEKQFQNFSLQDISKPNLSLSGDNIWSKKGKRET